MRCLWIADAHANLPAFETVVRDAGKVDEVVFLGDIVGCGPHPAECIDLLRQLNPKAIQGNHDAAIVAIRKRADRQTNPVEINEWTLDQLNESQLSYIETLPGELEIVSNGINVRVMHHLSGAPYLHPAMPDSVFAAHLHNVPYPVVFCGHSHRQMDRTVNGQRYVCIPPIGQPRNRDPRAGYVIEQDGILDFRYVAYDVERTVADIEKIGLGDELTKRWSKFLRTGFDDVWSRDYEPEKA